MKKIVSLLACLLSFSLSAMGDKFTAKEQLFISITLQKSTSTDDLVDCPVGPIRKVDMNSVPKKTNFCPVPTIKSPVTKKNLVNSDIFESL